MLNKFCFALIATIFISGVLFATKDGCEHVVAPGDELSFDCAMHVGSFLNRMPLNSSRGIPDAETVNAAAERCTAAMRDTTSFVQHTLDECVEVVVNRQRNPSTP